MSSKLVAPLIGASHVGGLGSAFLTVCQKEAGFVFSTTVFQGCWVPFRIAHRQGFLTLLYLCLSVLPARKSRKVVFLIPRISARFGSHQEWDHWVTCLVCVLIWSARKIRWHRWLTSCSSGVLTSSGVGGSLATRVQLVFFQLYLLYS